VLENRSLGGAIAQLDVAKTWKPSRNDIFVGKIKCKCWIFQLCLITRGYSSKHRDWDCIWSCLTWGLHLHPLEFFGYNWSTFGGYPSKKTRDSSVIAIFVGWFFSAGSYHKAWGFLQKWDLKITGFWYSMGCSPGFFTDKWIPSAQHNDWSL